MSESLEEVVPRRGLSKSLKDIWATGESVSYLTQKGLVLQFFTQGIKSILSAPIHSLLTILTVSIVLLIFGVFLIGFQNIQALLASTKEHLNVSLFLDDQVTDHELQELMRAVRSRKEVKNLEFWSKSRALLEFRSSLGEEADVLDGLDVGNPLPASIEVQFVQDELDDVVYQRFVNDFRQIPGVAHLQHNSSFLGQLGDVLWFVRILGFVLVVLLCVVSAFVIGSTIRLALHSRRNDIAIMRLVGAGSWSVKLPCFVEGLIQGCAGAIGAIFLLRFSFDFFISCIEGTLVSELLTVSPIFLGFGSLLIIVLVGTIIGGLGAFIAVRKLAEV